MLPKVANAILHHTGRAVAAVQGQTVYTFRNVLQSSSGTTTANWTGASSSGWGGAGAGAGAGGAKYHSSSRFYNGYTGAGRAITQANQSTANDSGYSQNDENDDVNLTSGSLRIPRRFRARSNSLVLSSRGKNERAEKLGVSKVVQIHARASHAFASNMLDEPNSFDPVESGPSRPVLVRRNSTSTAASPSGNQDLSPTPASPAQRQIDLSDPAAPQSVTPPFEDDPKHVLSVREGLQSYLRKGSGNAFLFVKHMLDNKRLPADIDIYDLALEVLSNNRKSGAPVDLLVRLYDDLVKRGLVGTGRTYGYMIKALGDRDQEVHKAIATIRARVKRRKIADRATGKQHDFDVDQLEKLQAENNIRAAINLFQSALAARLTVSQSVLITLIRSCALNTDEYAALRVFAHLEKRYPDRIPVAAFYYMLHLYGHLKNVDGAVEIFNEYRKASQEHRTTCDVEDEDGTSAIFDNISRQISPWNKMVEIYLSNGHPAEALSLLEEMMDSKTSDSGVPLPTVSTFHTVISGFCRGGDINTGLLWFRRLLQEDYVASDPHESVTKPPRPDIYMWRSMIAVLVEHGMIKDLKELFGLWIDNADRDGTYVAPVDRLSVMEATLKYLEANAGLSKEEAHSHLDYLLERIVGDAKNWAAYFGTQDTRSCDRTIQLYERYNDLDKATDLCFSFAEAQKAIIATPEAGAELEANQMRMMTMLRNLVVDTAERIICRTDIKIDFQRATKMVAWVRAVGMFPTLTVADAYVALYEDAKEKGQVGHLTQQNVEYLIAAGVTLSYVKPGNESAGGRSLARFQSLLVDMTRYVHELSSLSGSTFEGILRALLSWFPESDLPDVFSKLGNEWQTAWNHTKVQRVLSRMTNMDEQFSVSELVTEASIIAPHGSNAASFKTSEVLSRSIDEVLNNYDHPAPRKAYDTFMSSFRNGVYPFPDTLGRLINALGRQKELEKVAFLYETAQHALSVREMETTSPQSAAWFQVEDQMIVALAHAGDIEGAHRHRLRMLEYGGAPSADAYGALIRCVKDTTDDSANAYNLFRESQIRGVVPNVYLYNTMISKLAKARKADYAMELFHKMKANGFWPSSVSYGAVIGACCRVGDHQSAELLFQEMSVQQNFKPRIPPYNTMMQLYTYTKPNRERVLYYYNALLEAKVKPTAHTYKLLMDAYGTIEPTNLEAMEDTFQRLCADQDVQVQGTHWGSIINAYGCVQKDLTKTIQVFDSIASHPSTLKSRALLPDAVAYEALINVFVTLRCIDLIQGYMQRFEASGVHMTAYIANLLIKGYAVSGNVNKARQVFESLHDPQQGVAAPNNHAPHGSSSAAKIDRYAPVYREPSTWEVMVRAELGNGNRDQAVVLLERMQARRFPAAVYSRISGIMLDDAVSPWPASPVSPSTEN